MSRFFMVQCVVKWSLPRDYW